jgi:hypothetical protein
VPHDVGLVQQDIRVTTPGLALGRRPYPDTFEQETEVRHDVGRHRQDAVRQQVLEVGRQASARDGGQT